MSSSSSSKDAQLVGPVSNRPGFSAWMVSGSRFEVQSHYRLIRAVGTGAYGVVVSAEDTRTGRKVAIKKVPNAFHDLTDALRILREIRLLRHFNHENIVALVDLGPPESLNNFEDVYIFSELVETDLHRIIYSRQELTDEHVAYFIYQMLVAVKYMHSAQVLHRDLKPSNILLNADCSLKVCDFGLARGVAQQPEGGLGELTEYVVTRWYRAPEVMLATQTYSHAIDVWAVGCIHAEILGVKPLFPGEDYISQLKLIIDVLGSPGEEDMGFIKSSRARAFMAKHAGRKRVPLSALFPKANPVGLDLLARMLEFNPARRITVEEALAHPYLASLHSPEDEPLCPVPFDFSFEAHGPLDKPALQRLMFEQIASYHPEVLEQEPSRSAAAMAGGGHGMPKQLAGPPYPPPVHAGGGYMYGGQPQQAQYGQPQQPGASSYGGAVGTSGGLYYHQNHQQQQQQHQAPLYQQPMMAQAHAQQQAMQQLNDQFASQNLGIPQQPQQIAATGGYGYQQYQGQPGPAIGAAGDYGQGKMPQHLQHQSQYDILGGPRRDRRALSDSSAPYVPGQPYQAAGSAEPWLTGPSLPL